MNEVFLLLFVHKKKAFAFLSEDYLFGVVWCS